MKEYGMNVVDEQLSRPGTMRRNWKQTLISDGWIIMRHPNWDAALHMMREAAEIRLAAGSYVTAVRKNLN